MDSTMPNSSNSIDNITLNQNYQDEFSKLNNAKVFRTLENGALHLIAVHRGEDDSMIDGAFLNSQSLLTNSIIVGHNGIGGTQTLIDGQYTVNFIDENYHINDQPINQHGNNDLQLQPAIFQMVNSKMEGQSVIFPGHNGDVTHECKRIGGTTSLKDINTLDMHTDNLKTESYHNIALPPLTPIRKIKSQSRSPKSPNETKFKIEQMDHGYVTQDQINCSLPSTSLDRSSNIQLSIEAPDMNGDLPHKKRITKKLKKQPQTVSNVINPSNDSSTTKFACQLCNTTIYGQLDFFAHLKEHYEPSNIVECETVHAIPTHELVESISGEVENNHYDNNSSMLFTPQHTDETDRMNSDLKCKLKDNVIDVSDHDDHDDTEFSDADDIFEGIQNVVNKVQDGSDWYDEDEFQATMSFKPGILDDDDDLDAMVQKEDSIDSEPSKLDDLSEIHNNIGDDVTNSDQKNSLNKFAQLTNKTDENKNADKPWAKCLICDKRFKSKNAYQYHETTHSGVRPHQCEDCGKCFSTIGALRIHSRLHTGVRPYKCRFCDRPFRQWGDMKYHITSIHTNEKKYQCEFCGKGFARRYSLVVHRRIHTGERNYRCEFCDKSFRASSYLVNHRRIHTGEKPHECSICEKKFRVRSDMKRHMNIHTRTSTKPSRKPQVSNKKGSTEEQSPSQVIVSIKNELIKKESNGVVELSEVIYSDQNIDILRKVLLTEKAASSSSLELFRFPTDSVTVKEEDPVDL